VGGSTIREANFGEGAGADANAGPLPENAK